VRSTGVSRRFACGFQTDLHFADEEHSQVLLTAPAVLDVHSGRYDI